MAKDRIERSIELKAPVSRVWKAVTDHEQFGTWFRTTVETPFVEGKTSAGNITYPGYEHLRFEAHVVKIEPERYFAFRWPQMDPDTQKILSEVTTLVEFTLEKTPTGTKVTVVESGFDRVPERIRERNFTGNEGGWTEQMKNIEAYVRQAA